MGRRKRRWRQVADLEAGEDGAEVAAAAGAIQSSGAVAAGAAAAARSVASAGGTGTIA